MNLYLLEKHCVPMLFKKSSNYFVRGDADFFLRDKEEKGKLQDGKFPWKVGTVPESDDVAGFQLYIYFTVNTYVDDEKNATSTTSSLLSTVGGDIEELLKYVFSTGVFPQDMKLQLKASVQFPDGTTTNIQHELKFDDEDEDPVYVGRCKMGNTTASQFYSNTSSEFRTAFSTKLTMKLVNDTKLPSSLEELNKRILKTKVKSDLVLVAADGFEMPCHQNFLAVHCPAFEETFEKEANQSEQNRYKLNLSEEGLEALLDFVYCFKLNVPSDVAVELLETATSKQMPMLKKAMNDLLLEKPDDWFYFDDALQLFLHCIKVEENEGLKSKAVKAMKLYQDDMETSKLHQSLVRTDPESAMILRTALSGQ